MSSIKFELAAELRKDIGRGASRRLRQVDKIPAVVYGAGEDPVSLVLDHNKTKHALANEAFYSHILVLQVGKKKEKVILKAMQRHPAKPRILHMDFLRVRADQKLEMHVPLHFLGEDVAPGVKEGGVFSHLLSDLQVSCFPDNLPEFIAVDVSQMGINQALHLSDIKLPEGVEIVALSQGEGHDAVVVQLQVPRIIEEEVIEPVAGEGEVPAGAVPAEGKGSADEKAAGSEEKKE